MAKGLRQIVNFTAAILSVVFSIVVLGVIAKQVLKSPGNDISNKKLCYYEFDPNSLTTNESTSICDFGIAMGAISLLVSIAYVVFGGADLFVEVEILLGHLALILRSAGAGFMALLWMICFGVLTNAYNNKSGKDAASIESSVKSGMQAGIAFSFLTTLLWIIILIFTLSIARAARAAAGTFKAGTGTSAAGDSSIQPQPLQES